MWSAADWDERWSVCSRCIALAGDHGRHQHVVQYASNDCSIGKAAVQQRQNSVNVACCLRPCCVWVEFLV